MIAAQEDNVTDNNHPPRPPVLRGNSSSPTEGAPSWNRFLMYGVTVVSTYSFMFTHVKYVDRLTSYDFFITKTIFLTNSHFAANF